MELKGKTAVITGGASGIGLATAIQFSKAGANIVLGDIEDGPLHTEVQEMRSHGANVIGVHCDVAQESDVERLRDTALKEFGAVHVIFNNAGVAGGSTIGTPKKIWDWVMSVNLEGVVNGMGNMFVEVDEPLRRSSVEAVDRLIVISDREHRESRASQKAQEQHVGGGEILELIYQKYFSLAFGGESSLRLAQEPFDRKEDELIEIGQAMLREMRAKLWIEPHKPIDVTLVGILNFFGRLES